MFTHSVGFWIFFLIFKNLNLLWMTKSHYYLFLLLLLQYPEQLELKQCSIKDKCCTRIVKELHRSHTRRCKENIHNGENVPPLPPLLASRRALERKKCIGEGGNDTLAHSGISKHCPFPVKRIIGSPCHEGR